MENGTVLEIISVRYYNFWVFTVYIIIIVLKNIATIDYQTCISVAYIVELDLQL